MNEDFHCFEFHPIALEEFVRVFSDKYNLSQGQARDIYDDWLEEFRRKAIVFYQAQYDRHERNLRRAFCVQYHLLPDELFDYEIEERWKRYIANTDLSRCRAIRENATMLVARQSYWGDDNQIGINYDITVMESPKPSEINETWFNTIVNVSGENREYLKNLSYPLYLQTMHWHRVKSALMLIRGATCQERECYSTGDSWYFGDWEAELHPHHLTYKNRGSERYNDLVLLCKRHHEQWHNKEKAGDTSNIDWVYL